MMDVRAVMTRFRMPISTRWGQRFAGGSLLVCVLLLVACGEKDYTVKPTGPPPPLRLWSDGTKAPFTTVTSVKFQGDLITPKPILVTKESVLEFLPMVVRNAQDESVMSVALLTEGDEIPLGEFPAYFSGLGPETPSNSESLIDHIVRIDLGKYDGKLVQFKWWLSAGGVADYAEVAMFKVYKKQKKNDRPHILMICSDTHRYDYALAGEGPNLMPRLTEFREESVSYHRAYSDAAWTLPSIASTMTGRFPKFHLSGRRSAMEPLPADGALGVKPVPGSFNLAWAGVVRHFTLFPTSGIDPFTKELRDEGYFTSWIAGNMFYTLSTMNRHGLEVGFDMRSMRGSKLNAVATKLIDDLPADRPNFLLVHYLDVHQFRLWNFKEQFPNEDPLTTDRENLLKCYREAVQESDKYLGELLDAWKQKFGFENTLVIFYSDHGDHLHDPGYPTFEELARDRGDTVETFNMDIPLIDHGNSMDEALLHIPLVVRYPDSYELRGENHDSVALVDLYPTIFDVAGIPIPEGVEPDGESLLKIRENEGKRKGAIHADYQLYGEEMSSVREGPLKYVIKLDEEDKITEEYLVDTSMPYTERGEFGQRVENEESAKRLKKLIEDYSIAAFAKTTGLASEEIINMSEAELRALREQGYFK